MGMTVTRRKDSSIKRVFAHKIADIRGGVSVQTADLTQDYLAEGTPISKPDSNGITHVVKFAILKANAAADATTYTVEKGHNFKVGDFIMLNKSAKAYAITAIATNATTATNDDITAGTTIGAATAGAAIYQAAAQSASNTSAFKYIPFALVGTGKQVVANQNIDTDAWLIGVTCGNELPSLIAAELKGIINY